MRELEIMKRIQVSASKLGARLFRNNVGQGWVGSEGSIVKPTVPKQVTIFPNDVLLRNARPLHAGLCDGSSDLIGWSPCEIGGQRVAIFTAAEVKTERGRLTEQQAAFLNQVNTSGGIGIEARSIHDLEAQLHGKGIVGG